MAARLKQRYPDMDFADDESMYSRIHDDYDEYDEQIKGHEAALEGYKANEDTLTKLFTNDKRSARFLVDMADGKNPFVRLVEEMGIDGVTDMFENPDYADELAEANQKYVERMVEGDRLKSEFETNLRESLGVLEQIQSERGLSDEVADQVVEELYRMATEALAGKFTRESIEAALKALNYDNDVAQAGAAGELKGRNHKIRETLRKPTAGGGDTVPMLGGSNNAPKSAKGKSLFQLGAEAR